MKINLNYLLIFQNTMNTMNTMNNMNTMEEIPLSWEEHIEEENTKKSSKPAWNITKELKKSSVVDTKDYPELGTDKKNIDKSMPKFNKSTVKEKYYLDKHYTKKDEVPEIDKKTIFSTLSDKVVLVNNLFKTRMCSSIDNKEKCPHGQNCRFAHFLGELIISNCLFGSKCKFVKNIDGKLVNSSDKCCQHKHPDETVDEYYIRTNLIKYKKQNHLLMVPMSVQYPQRVLTTTKLEVFSRDTITSHNNDRPPPSLDVSSEDNIKFPPGLGISFENSNNVRLPPSLDVSSENSNNVRAPILDFLNERHKLLSQNIYESVDEIYLRVTRELAMSCFDSALARGKKKIHIEII